MLKKQDIKEIIKVGTILFAITALSALVLATINGVTAPVIAQNNAKKEAQAMSVVLNQASEFSDNLIADKIDVFKELSVSAIYEGKKDDNSVGYVVMVSPNGYGGAISMVVGIDYNKTVTGIDIISQSETAGLGAKCTQEEFKNKFIGKTNGITVVKSGAKDNQIDAISSATVTSKAVTKGVNQAFEAIDLLEGEK